MRSRTALIIAFLALLGCSERRAPATAPLVDDFGEQVDRGTSTAPARIVSLNPTTTDLLFAMGAGARVVGRTHWDTWSDSVRRVADLGPGLRPNVESVLGLHPDLVILYASADNGDAARQLRAAGVDVIGLKVDRLADFERATLMLGVATGEEQRARSVVDSVMRTIDRVRVATRPLPRPSVFWHIWDSPVIAIGGGSYMDELLNIAGGRNVYGESSSPSPVVSIEDVIHRNPDIIIAGPEGAAHIRSSPVWRSVGAVRRGHVVVIDTMLVGRPAAQLGEAAVAIARLLHPEAGDLP